MASNGIDSRRLSSPMVRDLEYKAIVNLKQNLDPRELSELKCAPKTYLCDSRLRSPGDSVRKYGINSVEIYDSVAEAISDAARSEKRFLNPLVPNSDSGMEPVEPKRLFGLELTNGPSKHWTDRRVCKEGFCGAEVVRGVDESFERIVEFPFFCACIFVVTGGGGESRPEQILAVHEVDGFPGAESLFQLRILGLPRHHLGVGAGKVGVNYHFSVVGHEHFPDVWEPKLLYVSSSRYDSTLGDKLGICECCTFHLAPL